MAIWYNVQKAWPVPAVKGTLWENLACKPSWTRVSEMKEDPHKQVADKLIWATQFCKLGFGGVPLKFQDFRGGLKIWLWALMSGAVCPAARLKLSVPFKFWKEPRTRSHHILFCSSIQNRCSDEIHSYVLRLPLLIVLLCQDQEMIISFENSIDDCTK